MSAAEKADQANDRALRVSLADEVARGEKSFEEAGCDYRQGLWDDDAKTCGGLDPITGLRKPS